MSNDQSSPFESNQDADKVKDDTLSESYSGEPTSSESSAPEVTVPVPTNSETTAQPSSESETSSQTSSETFSQEDNPYSQEKSTEATERENLVDFEKGQTTENYAPYQPPTYAPAANYEQQVNAYGTPAPSGYQGSAASYNPPPPLAGQPYHHNNGGYSTPPQTTKSDTPLLVLLLGIGGLLFPFISFVAWYMGGKAKKEFAARGVNDSMLNAGYILGIIGSIFQILFILFIFMMVIVSFSATAGGV